VRDLVRAFAAWATARVAGEMPPNRPTPFDDLKAELAGIPGGVGPHGGCLILARMDDVPVGCVGSRDLGGATVEVKRMFVRPEAWGRGVGSAMLDRLLAEARATGHVRSIPSTHRARIAAQALCARKGFAIVPHSGEFPGVQPDIDLCMRMSLDAPSGAIS
jgi:carbonic anhydrase